MATRHRVAPACRATLVIASDAMRNAATSTAAGRAGIGSGPVTSIVRSPDSAAARCRIAREQPDLVDRRRPQVVDEASYLRDRRLHLFARLGQQRVALAAVGRGTARR